ncbi:MAG TPA: DUF2059 domain-containing protein [Afifellaceae bacterium]|nr:DUF2059 domain-containing protein [Afifellaceae bacterium]
MFRLLAICLLAFAAAGLSPEPVRAQDSNQAATNLPPLSPEHLELARQAFVAAKAGRAFDEILPVVADRAKATFIQANPQMQLGIIDVVDRVALDLVKERKTLDDGLIRVWARAFDPAELEGILAFFESPAGQKFATEYPKVISTQLAVADNWTLQIGNELGKRVRAELRTMIKSDAQKLEGGNTNTQGQ